MDAKIPAEVKFVTSVVQPEPDIGRIEALAARSLDWERVIQEATQRHKVGPLLYRNLTESGSDDLVPDQIIERLQQQARQTAIRNLSAMNLLLSILEHLDERGIPALPYKGPVLSEAIYADFSLRQSRDLDILVQPDDLYDAEAFLIERGFEPNRELTEKQKHLLVKHGRNRTMQKEGIIVDLHPRVSSPDPPFEVTDLLGRASSVDLAGDTTPAIRPVDHLFVLSVHGTRHRWNQLKWICDIAYLIQNETFDWPAVLEEAKQRNCYRRVLLGCRLASTVLMVELPEVVSSKFQNVQPYIIDNTYPDCLLGIDDNTTLRYRVYSRDGPLNMIQYFASRLAIPPVGENSKIVFPEPVFGLNYVLHPIRAICSKLRG